ncbi:MAG: DUF1844 domain-containing protein [Candidatus Adiutrix sp.]|jgi:hypothetical protein|nr:DUF1844 domain-containing protein [Candidatus Adiutrix sp.]
MSEEFVVNDRRLFRPDGQLNPDADGPEEAPQPPPAGAEARQDRPASSAYLPPADLAGLLVGLATSALIHLGENPDGGPTPSRPDLPAARHAIDLLAVLQAKTKGNLLPEEEALLTTLLYDLRMKYVKASADPPKK